MALTCSVQKCSNGAYWLNKWKKQLCDQCGCLHNDAECKCAPPFRLFPFPTAKKQPERRTKWKQLLGRQNSKEKKLWSPTKDSRVCSQHFVDSEPTVDNPLPTLNLGYNDAPKRVKRMTHLPEPQPKRPKVIVLNIEEENHSRLEENNDSNIVLDQKMVTNSEDPDMEMLPRDLKCHWIVSLLAVFLGIFMLVSQQKKQIKSLSNEVNKLKMEVRRLRQVVYTENVLRTDEDVNFYTGIPTLKIFVKLHSLISPLVNRRWTGPSSLFKNVRKFKFSGNTRRFGPDRKMSSKTEFLLTLMKLRLGLLNCDLAKRFDISTSLCSRVFLSWIRACSQALKSVVYIPDQDALIGSKPERFRTLPDLHSIIDCTELFIETPKDLLLQNITWSEYKHHNTVKILVACSPNSQIVYISPAFTGRISDKALTNECGYLDKLPPYSMIMADKGFNIVNECADRNITLYVPPGRRGASQMSSASVSKTKRIANHRILIEQVIRRLKTFRILANEIPLSLIGHVDQITIVCAALSNFREPIYKT